MVECSECGSIDIYHRKTKDKSYRCRKCGNEFNLESEETEEEPEPEETEEVEAEPEETEETETFEVVEDKGANTPLEDIEL